MASKRRKFSAQLKTEAVQMVVQGELEEEVRRLRMENEFLKKAAAFFARMHD
jgi:transposase-like protein